MTAQPRSQDELHARCRYLLNRYASEDGSERRYQAYVHAVNQATARRTVDGIPLVHPDSFDRDNPDVFSIEQFPDDVPSKQQVRATAAHEYLRPAMDLLQKIRDQEASIAQPGWAQWQLIKKQALLEDRRAETRTLLDNLSEFAWILGHPLTAERMLTREQHVKIVGSDPPLSDAYIAVVRWCDALKFRIEPTVPDPNAPGLRPGDTPPKVVNLDMAHAIATVRAEG